MASKRYKGMRYEGMRTRIEAEAEAEAEAEEVGRRSRGRPACHAGCV